MWKFSLHGVIVGQKPLFNAMEHYVHKLWKVMPAISLTDKGVFVFQFDNQLDMESVLNVGHWTINGGYPLFLRQWQPGM